MNEHPSPESSPLAPRGEAEIDAQILSQLSYVNSGAELASVSIKRQKSGEDFLAIASEHRLRMKLHAAHWEVTMTQRHDFAVVAFCGDFEAARE